MKVRTEQLVCLRLRQPAALAKSKNQGISLGIQSCSVLVCTEAASFNQLLVWSKNTMKVTFN